MPVSPSRRIPSGTFTLLKKGGPTVIAFVQDPDGYKIELIERPAR